MYGYGCSGWREHLVRFHEQGDAVRFHFVFSRTVPIGGGWRVDLSRQRLRKKSAKISRTFSSLPPESARTDSAKDTPPTATTPSSESDESSLRDYDLPIPSWMAVTLTTMTTTTMKKSREGTSWLESLDNQTYDIITQDIVYSIELTTMVTVTKNNPHCQINWGSVYKGFFFVKWIWNRNQFLEIESEIRTQNTNKIKDNKYSKQKIPIKPVNI